MKKSTKYILMAAGAIALIAALLGGSWAMGQRLGSGLGSASGTLVGKAVGSYHGITEGYKNGSDQGRTDGLSGDDIEINAVHTTMEDTGKLEVLVAGVSLVDQQKIGLGYKALFRVMGDAVFTVDLTKTAIDLDENGVLQLSLPQPEMDFQTDEQKTEKFAEYQRHSFTGDAKAGHEAYLKSRAKMEAEVEKYLPDYDNLMDQARDAAIRQVTQLAQKAGGQRHEVSVKFAAEEGTKGE